MTFQLFKYSFIAGSAIAGATMLLPAAAEIANEVEADLLTLVFCQHLIDG